MKQVTTTSSSLASKAGWQPDITNEIFQMVKRRQACDMEDLVKACSAYTWNQVFLEVDRMSRTGELRLLSKQAGVYTVTLPAA
jgi:hypothetical protein